MYERLETLTQRPVMGYREKEKEFAPYIRIFFKSLYERRKAITYLNNMGYNTAADDTTCYYRMVSRELNYLLQVGYSFSTIPTSLAAWYTGFP